MPRKSVDEFKRAFSAIKKPGRPKKVSSKLKGELEKAVEDKDETVFVAKLDEIKVLDRDYMIELVAYKFGKHLDDSSKMPTWHTKVPPDVSKKALERIIPGDMTDPATKRLMDQSIKKGDIGRVELLIERDPQNAPDYFRSMKEKDVKDLLEKSASSSNKAVSQFLGKLLYERNPEGTLDFLVDANEKAIAGRVQAGTLGRTARERGDEKESKKQFDVEDDQKIRSVQFSNALEAALGPDMVKLLAKRLLKKKTDKTTQQLLPLLDSMKPDLLEEIALSDPGYFVENVLTKASTTARMKMMSDPKFRATLEKSAPKEWKAFSETVPMLRLYKSVTDARGKDDDSGNQDAEQLKNVQAIFDKIMDGGDVPAAYIGTKSGNPSEIMAKIGPADDEEEAPRTDCHNMLMVLNATIQGYPGMMPGLGEKLKWGHCTNMLMTKPLSGIGMNGRGLLDKTFSGNVFDDGGAPTGQILFTGEDGVNSHSWLEADGMAYDPVLGISGTVGDVQKGSTFQTFDWKVRGTVGIGGGWYFIKHDPAILKTKAKLTVAANKMSFNTAYYLTKDPSLHLTKAVLDEVMK